jgi:MOSC domain-containing protein YiiM
MQLVSVNVSLPREVPTPEGVLRTGIFKQPVRGRVLLRTLNLVGDAQADLQNHGGVYQAVYAYPGEHYARWARELSRTDLTFGQFGENFTVAGMPEDEVCIGDVFRVGGALVEVTQPRVPCFKLALKMGSSEFPKRFLASGRVGFYMRVLEEGEVGAGDVIERVRTAPDRMSVRTVIHLFFFDRENTPMNRRAAQLAALSPEWRGRFAERAGRFDLI